MDERTLAIVKAMAKGLICYDDCSSMCLHCDSEEYDNAPDFREIRHRPGCPVLIARVILKEQGTPMNVYKVRYEYINITTPKRQYWRSVNAYTAATTQEEAIQEYTWEQSRNVQAEFVREIDIPLQR